MPYLIDGHNLIGKMPNISLSDRNDEDKLINLLRVFAERSGKRITVVFDPHREAQPQLIPAKAQYGAVHVIFADAGIRADDVIRVRLNGVRDKQGLIVVTSDRAVADYARVSGVRTMSSEAFAEMLNRTNSERHSPEKPQATHHEVTNWGEVFKEPPARSQTYVRLPTAKELAEEKRQRRNAQLAKQVKNQQRLS